MALFQWGEFVGASGGKLPFKIECDVLADADSRQFEPITGMIYGGDEDVTELHSDDIE
jgi:hypothetical protein